MFTESATRCHRCGIAMTLHLVGDDYCFKCKSDIRAREQADRRRHLRVLPPKDLTPFSGGAA